MPCTRFSSEARIAILDEIVRIEILEAQLSKMPEERFDCRSLRAASLEPRVGHTGSEVPGSTARGSHAHAPGLEIPVGLLLVGPPGDWEDADCAADRKPNETKLLYANHCQRSCAGVGDSVKRVSAVFERAKDHSPAIIFSMQWMDCCQQTVTR